MGGISTSVRNSQALSPTLTGFENNTIRFDSSGLPVENSYLQSDGLSLSIGTILTVTSAGRFHYLAAPSLNNSLDIPHRGYVDNLSKITITAQNANYIASSFEHVDVTTGNTDITITLPSSPTINDIIAVSKADSGTGSIVVNGAGNNIQDTTTYTSSNNQFDTIFFKFNGTFWYLLSELYGNVDAERVTGTFNQNKITALHDDLIARPTSPDTTIVGNFPRYADTQGTKLDGGANSVGAGNTVVTLNDHNHIDPIYLPENIRRYPDLPPAGYTNNVTVTVANASNYLEAFNIFDGSISSSVGLSVTFADAAAFPTKSDFSNDDDTMVIANYNQVPMTLAIIPGSQTWRVNTGTLAGDITLPQFHYIQLARLSGFSSQIYVSDFGIIDFIAPGSSITLTDFTIPEDVPLGTIVSGSQTLKFKASGASNMERDDYGLLISGTAGGVSFGATTMNFTTPLLKEGENTLTFTIPTSRTLSQDGDFYRISLFYESISPNVTENSLNQWRIDARDINHPTQATFKYGWIESTVALDSVAIDSAFTTNASNVVTPGAISSNTIPNNITVPGVDANGKRFIIEVQGDLGTIDRIVENPSGLNRTVYHADSKLDNTADFNAITYSKTVGGTSKDFTLIYNRLTKLEGYEGTVLKLIKE